MRPSICRRRQYGRGGLILVVDRGTTQVGDVFDVGTTCSRARKRLTATTEV